MHIHKLIVWKCSAVLDEKAPGLNCSRLLVNPLMPTLKPHSSGPLYNNTVIGTLAVDGWAVIFGTAMRCLGGLRP